MDDPPDCLCGGIYQFQLIGENAKPVRCVFSVQTRAIPQNQLKYRPHDKSTAAGALAWQFAEEQKQLAELLETGQVVFETRPHPPNVGDIVTAWDNATNDLRKRLKSADENRWSGLR